MLTDSNGRVRDACADAREDLPRNSARGAGVIMSGDGLIALGADQDHFIAGRDARNLRDIENRLIHADAAHQRRALYKGA